jgi:hypothetical protein
MRERWKNATRSDQAGVSPDGLALARTVRGLIAFIARAAGPDAADFKVRAMLYEFRYPPVGEAFGKAAAAGADVQIRYEAQSYKTENEAMIAATGIGGLCQPQKSRAGIRHNKFMVLVHKNIPVAVWTGSTNISAGGIFGHSNVGHAVWNRDIAQRYLDFWTRLADPNVKPSTLKLANLAVEPTPGPDAPPPADRILTLYSPRDEKPALPTLNWYANRMASAQRIMCMTFAFNFDAMFKLRASLHGVRQGARRWRRDRGHAEW